MKQRTLPVYFSEDDSDVLDWMESKRKAMKVESGINVKPSPQIVGLLRLQMEAEKAQ